MSSSYGPGGRNNSYGWANIGERPEDPAVTAWLAALWAKPFTAKEYDEMRRIAAERTRAKEVAK